MPFKEFKKSFGRYTVTMYRDDWLIRHTKSDGEKGPKFNYYFTNPAQ